MDRTSNRLWNYARASLLRLGGILLCTDIFAAIDYRLDARLVLIAALQQEGPCANSLIGPVTKGCIEWQPNVDAAAIYEPSRRLVFTGAADEYLHILDADTGRRWASIKTQGRVVTETLFAENSTLMYVGTDKGVLHAFDAYNLTKAFLLNTDSKINNDLILVENLLVFTSALGTIYCLDKNSGVLKWRLEQPRKDASRPRLARHSNIVVVEGDTDISLVIPHADGYVSLIDARTGGLKKRIDLGIKRSTGFTDIVAPMVWLNNKLWAASYDLGVKSIDLNQGKIVEQVELREVVQLASDGLTLFAASMDNVYALSGSGKILWNNHIGEMVTTSAKAAYPFAGFTKGFRRVFYGQPSRPLLSSNHVILGTSAGAMGFFNKLTGRLENIVGNSVGFGSKISWADATNFFAVTRRGLLMKFQIFDTAGKGLGLAFSSEKK